MKYMMYRLRFPVGAHFGEKNLSDSQHTFLADTLFSALYLEMRKREDGSAQRFLDAAGEGQFALSDAFPYIGKVNYLPKPIQRIQTEGKDWDPALKKAYKKLTYVPMDKMQEYLQGKLDVVQEAERLQKLGSAVLKTSAGISGKPYHVGVYYFAQDAGLYFIAKFAEEEWEAEFFDILDALSFSGLGGKRSSGVGRFEIEKQQELPAEPFERQERGNGYMTLGVALPGETELEEALAATTGYQLIKRGGFVASETYAPTQRKKDDLYVLQAGSCFTQRFSGDIYDVSGGGEHPVYRYAKPIFWTL